MEDMTDITNSSNLFDCYEASMQKAELEGSSPILEKSIKGIQVSQNVYNCKAAESQDRLSDLPDALIRHILSFMETKDVIRTCVLSTRWKNLWTSIPCLNFNSKSFSQLRVFREFVKCVLLNRGSSPVKVLIYCRFGVVYSTDQYLLNKVVEYAALHGVEEIRINLRAESSSNPPLFEIPSSLFTCQSLRRLELRNCQATNVSARLGCKSLEMLHLEHFSSEAFDYSIANPFAVLEEYFGLTTLTTLHLNNLTLLYIGIKERLDPFANCVNLKNLHLSKIFFESYLNPMDFVISAPQLNNLTLICNCFKCNLVVVAPKLTNFSYFYSTPFAFLEFNLPSLDGLGIDILEKNDEPEKSLQNPRHGLINMSRGNHNSEAIKLSLCTVEITCGNTALLEHECSPFTGLKTLNVGLGYTYKIFIRNLNDMIAYFRNCNSSQHSDFEIVTV